MDTGHEDRFGVFIRHDVPHWELPDEAEEPVAVCGTYGEARRFRRQLRTSARDCVIRYLGTAGGGD